MLKAVFQRGLGAFNTSHSPKIKSASQWSFARVNAFLYLIKNGKKMKLESLIIKEKKEVNQI